MGVSSKNSARGGGFGDLNYALGVNLTAFPATPSSFLRRQESTDSLVSSVDHVRPDNGLDSRPRLRGKDEMGVPRCGGTPITDTCPFPTVID